MDAVSHPDRSSDMAEIGNNRVDQLLLTALDIHTEAFPENLDDGIGAARHTLRTFLQKRLDNSADLGTKENEESWDSP